MPEPRRPAGLPRGPLLAAAIASLPAFAVPFLSDDWANLRTGFRALLGPTPYGWFRPVSQATFTLDRATWGTWPVPWHLTNLVFVVAATALLVALVQRHARDRGLAALTGYLFALHPYHVDNVAWISGRSDPIAATFLFAAMLAYDRWRARGGETPRGAPAAALVLFALALASKEAAIVLPAIVVAVGVARDRRPPRAPEILQGILPLVAVAALHVFWLRPLFLGPSSLEVLGWFGEGSLRQLLRYATAALVPLRDAHFFDGSWLLAGFGPGGAIALVLAALTLAGLALSARARGGRVPPVAAIGCALFVLTTLPSLLWFHTWAFFLPGAASCLALAALLRAAGRRAALAAGALVAIAWSATAVDHWLGWRDASRASAALCADLAEASRHPAVDRILVANLPRLVRGKPVGMEFTAAIETLGGRPVPVDYVTYLDYRRAFDDDLDGPPDQAVRRTAEGVVVELLVPERLDSRNVVPGPEYPDRSIVGLFGTVRFLEPNHMSVLIPPPAPGTAVYLWRAGRLEAIGPGTLAP